MTRFVVYMLSIGMVVFGAGATLGQDYPNKTIRIVTSAPGGSTDFVSRIIAQGIAGPLAQPVIVDNRSTNIYPEIVARALPDGYTLGGVAGSIWVRTLLQSTSYDPVRDFSPIALVARQPNLLVVHPSLPVKSVKELIALAKARPGALNYGATGAGSSGRLSAELFKGMAGVNMVFVPFSGNGPAVIALVGGELQLMFSASSSVMPHIKSDRLRALAITTAQPSPLFPELPTIAASGLPGYESDVPLGIFAPAKTPVTIINRLNQEIARLLTRPETKEKFFTAVGAEAVVSSPEQFAVAIKSDLAVMGKVIKDAGIREE